MDWVILVILVVALGVVLNSPNDHYGKDEELR